MWRLSWLSGALWDGYIGFGDVQLHKSSHGSEWTYINLLHDWIARKYVTMVQVAYTYVCSEFTACFGHSLFAFTCRLYSCVLSYGELSTFQTLFLYIYIKFCGNVAVYSTHGGGIENDSQKVQGNTYLKLEGTRVCSQNTRCNVAKTWFPLLP